MQERDTITDIVNYLYKHFHMYLNVKIYLFSLINKKKVSWAVLSADQFIFPLW